MSAIPADSLAGRLLAALPASRVATLHVASGAAVFRQGDPAKAVYVVVAGRVRLTRMSADGMSLILHVAAAGDSFAEASLSAPHYHCDAVAETDSTVLALPKADLLGLMTRDPAQALSFAIALAAQVRDLRSRLELRNIRSAQERVLAWLRLHAAGDPPRVPTERPWTLIAEELGLTREALYRALATLVRQGRIARTTDAIRLTGRGTPS